MVQPYADGMAIWYNIPECQDERTLYVEIPCGQCIECRKNKTREWQARLSEELKAHKYNYFITLTFSPGELELVKKKANLSECNALCGYCVRHMLERWRKDHKKSLKHWLVTELGHEGTERIHMHGLLLSDEQLTFGVSDEYKMKIWKYWRYGNIFVGDYCNQKTINYIVKYINKIDTDHKGFIGQIFCSPGIGKNWLERHENDQTYKYRPGRTRSDYVLNNGARISLPKYYKNKLHNEEERELIWRDFLDKEKMSIMGNEVSCRALSLRTIGKIVDKAKEENKFLGFGNDSKEWRKKDYNITERMLKTTKQRKFNEIIQKNINYVQNNDL